MQQPPEQQNPNPPNPKPSFTHQFICFANNIHLTFNCIPLIYKYPFPLILLTINILQLPNVSIIRSNSLTMDPGQIFTVDDVEWWRLWTYLLAIDVGQGLREILQNLGLVIMVGYWMGRVCVQRQYKNNLEMEGRLKSKQLQGQHTIDPSNTKRPKSLLKHWTITLFIQTPLFTLLLSFINCFIWFVWTSFGPHSFVSTGILPLAYYYFSHRRAVFIMHQTSDNLTFGLFPMKLSPIIITIMIGLVLIIFSMEAQSIFILMIYRLLEEIVIQLSKYERNYSFK